MFSTRIFPTLVDYLATLKNSTIPLFYIIVMLRSCTILQCGNITEKQSVGNVCGDNILALFFRVGKYICIGFLCV